MIMRQTYQLRHRPIDVITPIKRRMSHKTRKRGEERDRETHKERTDRERETPRERMR